MSNVCEYNPPGFSTGDRNEPSSDSTWWLPLFVSWFVHVTVSPAEMLSAFGANPACVIVTPPCSLAITEPRSVSFSLSRYG